VSRLASPALVNSTLLKDDAINSSTNSHNCALQFKRERGDERGRLSECKLIEVAMHCKLIHPPKQVPGRYLCKLDHEHANLAELADWSTESED